MEFWKKYTSDKFQIKYDQLIYKVGSYHYNWHDEIELLWLLKGKIEVNVDGKICTLEAGDLFVINSNCGHATFATKPDSIAMRLYVSPNFFLSQGVKLNVGTFNLNSNIDRINPQYNNLRADLANLQLLILSESSPFQIHALFFRIAESMLHFFETNSIKQPRYSIRQKRNFLDHAIQYLEDNFKKELTLEQLAQKCNYSTTYLSKIFKSELGINYYEYLTRCRLQHAIQQLAITDEKIANIAYDNGFNDIKAFNKMFKKHFGTTPSDYRKQINPDIQAIDKKFKTDLDYQEYETIIQILQESQQKNMGTFQDPCQICSKKEIEEKYVKLVKNLKTIVLEE
ncbi:AraC-like DNA-binding protein [Enterococcus sp. PF1-24]|uniref:AraC family transcriptional regulator n=1 Tax=unclassified Enterococcus TaxID=2608891 RepID=UPI002475ACA5|nr:MULTISPECIES: AraC family transcriptional regulator [unclassified Enterococcus]MDH6364681.1 AraC-like DNA-binding protein [Enterococcus sp. PFB1-1]MDH6401843.1 AraC-like DNA-binding protein [Enterococcus sp. PF1-24]